MPNEQVKTNFALLFYLLVLLTDVNRANGDGQDRKERQETFQILSFWKFWIICQFTVLLSLIPNQD